MMVKALRQHLHGVFIVALPDGSIIFPPHAGPGGDRASQCPPPTISSITPSFASVAVGGQATLTVNTNAPVVTDTTVTFTVSDPSAVTVSSSDSVSRTLAA